MGLDGTDAILSVSYKLISYSLTPRNINWGYKSKSDCYPRSLIYDEVGDILYQGVKFEEYYFFVKYRYLGLIRKNAQTGTNLD